MDSEARPSVADVTCVPASPGDTLIVRVPDTLNADEVAGISDQLSSAFTNNRVLVTTHELKFEAVICLP